MCGGDEWAARDRLYLPGLFGVFKGPRSAGHKPRGPKRHLPSNTGMNFRPKSPI